MCWRRQMSFTRRANYGKRMVFHGLDMLISHRLWSSLSIQTRSQKPESQNQNLLGQYHYKPWRWRSHDSAQKSRHASTQEYHTSNTFTNPTLVRFHDSARQKHRGKWPLKAQNGRFLINRGGRSIGGRILSFGSRTWALSISNLNLTYKANEFYEAPELWKT